jgi:hypothetical protein
MHADGSQSPGISCVEQRTSTSVSSVNDANDWYVMMINNDLNNIVNEWQVVVAEREWCCLSRETTKID